MVVPVVAECSKAGAGSAAAPVGRAMMAPARRLLHQEQTISRRAARVAPVVLRLPIRMVLAALLPVIPMALAGLLRVDRKPVIALVGRRMALAGPVRGIVQTFRRSLKTFRLYSMKKSPSPRI